VIDGARAAIWDGSELVVTNELRVHPPEAGEATVRLLASGICHSDLAVLDGTSPTTTPIVLGHEGAGVVERLGAGVDHVAVGDEVVVSSMTPCNECPACSAGRPSRCRQAFGRAAFPFVWRGTKVRSYANVSSFSTLVTVHGSQLVAAPGLPPAAAALLGCAVSTGWGAVANVAQVAPGETVVVVGVGGIGVNAIAAARLAGAASIIAVDIDPAKEAAARRFGADDFVADLGRVGEVDVIIECSGSPAAMSAAVGLATTVALVGIPPAGAELRVDARSLVLGRRLLGSLNGDIVPGRDLPALVELARNGDIDVAGQVSATWSLAEIDEAVRAARAGEVIRAVVDLT
jgi:S-(hydroxymethyl)glutathione dehydrogenase/alcohol dehydrogenase